MKWKTEGKKKKKNCENKKEGGQSLILDGVCN